MGGLGLRHRWVELYTLVATWSEDRNIGEADTSLTKRFANFGRLEKRLQIT